jgi:hypothetical protein
MAAAGSVVGLPLASSAQPSGIVLPSSAALRDRLALLGRFADVDESGGARRLVDDQRRPVGGGGGKRHRVGAVDWLDRARAGKHGRAVGGGERHQPECCQPSGEIAERAACIGVLLREDGDAEQFCRLGEVVDGAVEAGMRQPPACIGEIDRKRRPGDHRVGIAVDASGFQRLEIVDEMRQTDRGKPFGLG